MRHILVLSAVFCMAEPWWIFGSFYGDNWYRYPFLQQASYEARTAFNKIDNDATLTRGQREAALDKWAAQYNLVDAYNSYKNTTEKAKTERREALRKGIDDLAAFFTDLEQLQDDPNITAEEERQATQKLCSALDPSTRMAANYLQRLYDTDTGIGGFKLGALGRRSLLFDDPFFSLPKSSAMGSSQVRLW